MPLRQASLKIGFEARSGLVALFRILGEKPHDDGRQRFWDCEAINRRDRLTCDVAVDPFQRIGGSEWERAGQHLIQGDAQRVEIAPVIHRAVHAPGLLRGHIGKCAGDDLGRGGRQALAGEPGGNAEASEPNMTGVVDKYVLRLDVLMDEALPVGLAKCCRQTDGNAQEASQIDRLSLVPLD